MKTLFYTFLGMIGAASIGAGSWAFLTDGDLARTLYENDVALREVADEQRVEAYEDFGKIMKAVAAAHEADAANDQESEDSERTPARSNAGDGTPNTQPDRSQPEPERNPGSIAMIALEGLHDRAMESLNEAGRLRAEDAQNTRGVEESLRHVQAYLYEGIANADDLSDAEAATLATKTRALRSKFLDLYGGSKSSYGLLLSDNDDIRDEVLTCGETFNALEDALAERE